MENPFELILEKLNSIEKMIGQLYLKNGLASASADVTDINEASRFLGLSKSALYKMTCNREIPHYKRGKRLYFDKSELAKWVMRNKILSQDEIEKQAEEYIRRNPRR